MNTRYEMRLTGSGGQGVILATIILADAGLMAGKNTLQSQSYGPEARGGMCKAEVIVSDGVIGFTKVIRPSFLLALTQLALDKYAQDLPSDCIVMTDESLKLPAYLDGKKVITIPILRTAFEKVGKAFTANIVAVGAINAALNLASPEQIEQAVFRHIPAGTEELNRKALHEGEALVKSLHLQSFLKIA